MPSSCWEQHIILAFHQPLLEAPVYLICGVGVEMAEEELAKETDKFNSGHPTSDLAHRIGL